MIEQKIGSAKANAATKRRCAPDKTKLPPTREECTEAVQEYLSKGGTITTLNPEYVDIDSFPEDDITTYISPRGKLIFEIEEP